MNLGATDPVLSRALDAVRLLGEETPPWTEVLGTALALIGGESASLMVFSDDEVVGMEKFQIDPAAERDYLEHYYAMDIALPQALAAPPGHWLDTQDSLQDPQAARSPYYTEFMRDHRMLQIHALKLSAGIGPRMCLSFQRASVDHRLRERLEGERVRRYTDAFQAALHMRNAASAEWLVQSAAAFERFGEALCLVDVGGYVVQASPLAAHWLAQGELPLLLRGRRLWLDDAALRQALADAIACVGLDRGPVQLRLPATPGHRGGLLELVRAPRSLSIADRFLVLMRMRPTQVRVPDEEALCARFVGITPAEARVLRALASGQTPRQHAEAQGTSIHTVRKQVAMLLEKTGCQRQVDLVRKVLEAGS
ncbi:helix-turn-helix transcriptional regulator [Pseudacidovorax intermedius]|uniref:HTH luxR-type domain-containing protein n=1 Tax=Pseudacidovorax intermedius TaxID=433924 RepID=A0A147GUM9_9BURK|nr:helix-turn-helix transcriptional regulator [Pseudacidovorax intermedius]KTT21253.1 hypothetical protein NS331_12430 [Pseudacidovorax intermedius]